MKEKNRAWFLYWVFTERPTGEVETPRRSKPGKRERPILEKTNGISFDRMAPIIPPVTPPTTNEYDSLQELQDRKGTSVCVPGVITDYQFKLLACVAAESTQANSYRGSGKAANLTHCFDQHPESTTLHAEPNALHPGYWTASPSAATDSVSPTGSAAFRSAHSRSNLRLN